MSDRKASVHYSPLPSDLVPTCAVPIGAVPTGPIPSGTTAANWNTTNPELIEMNTRPTTDSLAVLAPAMQPVTVVQPVKWHTPAGQPVQSTKPVPMQPLVTQPTGQSWIAPVNHGLKNGSTTNQPVQSANQPVHSNGMTSVAPPGWQSSTTEVVTLQPTFKVMELQGERKWTTQVLECQRNMPFCMLGWCCACCYYCKVASRVNENKCIGCVSSMIFCFPCVGILLLRIKARLMLGIEGNIMRDMLLSYACPLCVLCQIDRELETAGYMGKPDV